MFSAVGFRITPRSVTMASISSPGVTSNTGFQAPTPSATVRVLAQTGEPLSGVALPVSSVVKNSANESVVWLHEQALVFRAVAVQPQALDGARVLVRQLPAGSRVVSDGASLLNQIR